MNSIREEINAARFVAVKLRIDAALQLEMHVVAVVSQ